MSEDRCEGWERPYIDVKEWREAPEPHCYVHGGFDGTDTRFSFYLPPAERWGGRFITAVESGQAGHEARAARLPGPSLPSMTWAFSTGSYLVESNGGHIAPGRIALTRAPHPAAVTAYGATAAATRYATQVAEEMYGRRPAHGYIVGGSGGGRALLGLENTRGVWDGAVQYTNAAGHGVSLPALIGNALRVLGPDLASVVAATEPGGHGDTFRSLRFVQRQALADLYHAGFASGSEWQLECPGPELGVVLITKRLLADYDPGYFRDFWEQPGYPGADGLVDADLVEDRLVVERTVRAGELGPAELARVRELAWGAALGEDTVVGLRAEGASERLLGADLMPADGSGDRLGLTCLGMAGDVLILDFDLGGDVRAVEPGVELMASNRDFLAYCHSYRHQVDLHSEDSLKLTAGGLPIYPQRELSLQHVLVGVSMSGEFDGKLIYVGSVNDSMSTATAWPVTYAGRVRRRLGSTAKDRLRVWMNDHATHIQASDRPPGAVPVATTRLVDWIGSVEQALTDLIAWVERGIDPPGDTRFELVDSQIRLPATATERGGLQPVVSAEVVTAGVAGEGSVSVVSGQEVRLRATAEVPPGAGHIVSVEWDLDGTGTFPVVDTAVDGTSSSVRSEIRHVYLDPGTYFPCVRVTAHREGDRRARHGLVPNLARVRVEVRVAP